MTNEEVVRKTHEEFTLRGMSQQTEESYLCALRLFLRYYENRSIETMGEPEIREFLLYQISNGKANSSVNIYNSALRFVFGAVLARNLNCRMIPRRRNRREFPEIMSRDEIVRFFRLWTTCEIEQFSKLFMAQDCAYLKLFICAFRTLTANRCAFLSIREKAARIALLCSLNETLIFFGNIGSNIVQIFQADICFTPEGKVSIYLLHDLLRMLLISTRQWPACQNPIRFILYGIVLQRIFLNLE